METSCLGKPVADSEPYRYICMRADYLYMVFAVVSISKVKIWKQPQCPPQGTGSVISGGVENYTDFKMGTVFMNSCGKELQEALFSEKV